ncbi:MAG: hypothetical protein BRD49_05225, partial [Bacteroidetes bacterium SW_10_40_5]
MHLSPFPHVEDKSEVPKDGTAIATPNYCFEADRSTCKEYYESIEDESGFHTCPYGFSSFVDRVNELIFTGLRIKKEYDKSLLQNRVNDEEEYLPQMPKKVIKKSAKKFGLTKEQVEYFEDKYFEMEDRIDRLRDSNNKFENFINKNLHEIRKFNADIKSTTESLLKISDDGQIERRARSVLAWSNLISARLNTYDIKNNPGIVTKGSKENRIVYKKFDKARMCYMPTLGDQDIRINISGESYYKWAMYDIFDLVPYLTLDNAIKYSPDNQNIEIIFEEPQDKLLVTVESIGPKVDEEELDKVTSENYRGSLASEVKDQG